MLPYFYAVGFTIVLWWSSTVAILYLDQRSPKTFIWSMAGGTGLLIVALWGIIETRGDTSTTAAYVGFSAGIVIWGWQLLSFYLGFITGPRHQACEPGLNGWRRFREGVKTSLHHELVVLAFGVVLVVICLDQPNKSALWTYIVLYWMHQSAKLNLFFGALNHGESLLPAHLRYLASFMKRQPMNLMFPVSVSVSTVVTVLLTQSAIADNVSSFELVMYSTLACLMALAVLEHWLLVLPLQVDALWQWGSTPDKKAREEHKLRRAPVADLRLSTPASNSSRFSSNEFASDYEDPAPHRYANLRVSAGLPHHFLRDEATKKTA